MAVLCKVAGAKSRNTRHCDAARPSHGHRNVTIPIRGIPRFAREARGSEERGSFKTLESTVTDNALTLISKSDHGGTIPSHTFFFFFMDGTRRIKLGGRQSHPVIFPENIMIGPQRIIKTAGWEVVTLTGTVLLSSIENNYFPRRNYPKKPV